MKILIIIATTLFATILAHGQSMNARYAEAYISSNHLVPGEQAALWVSVQGGQPDDRPKAPDVEGVAINFAQAITRLDTNQNLTQAFIYRVSAPNPGKYTIPSIEVISGGKRLLTKPLVFQIHPISSLKSIPTGVSNYNLKIGWFPAKTTLYQGEVCPVTLKIYSPERLRTASFGLPDPKKENCLAWRFSLPNRRSPPTTIIDGESHQITRYTTTLSGIAPGKASLGPAKLRQIVRERIIDPRFGAVFKEKPINLTLPAINFDILPLPADAPPNFNGAIGKFQILAQCQKTSLEEGQSTENILHIYGTGNLMSIKPPVLDDDTWKIIDTSKVTRGEERRFTTGRVTFRQLLRPGSSSLSSIPSYVLSYFDPSDKKYHTLKTPPIPVSITTVAKSSTNTDSTLTTPDRNTPPERMQDIIGFIDKPDPQHAILNTQTSKLWHLAPVAIALLIIGIAIRKRQKRNYRLNPDAGEKKLALNKLCEANDTRTFYRRAGRIIDQWQLGGAGQTQLQEIISERDKLCFVPQGTPIEEISAERKKIIIDLLKRSTHLLIILLIISFSPNISSAEKKHSRFTNQNSSYNTARDAWKSGSYQQAINLYQQEYPNPNKTPADILYNIGNCHHRLDQHGLAALAWRRALLADPTHQKARQNLRFTEISQNANVLMQFPWQRHLTATSSNTYYNTLYACGWAIVLATLAMILFLKNKKVLTVTIITICLSCVIASAAVFAIAFHPDGYHSLAPPEQQAVIITRTPLYDEAHRSTVDSTLELAPASLVRVIAQRGPWAHITTAEKEEGWIERKHLGKLIQDNHE
ncbi:MAG: BatD family protein [Akkermansiaceae bacterium]|nr:BatD family protein [Akkermansiaceae bacterium]